MPMSTASYPGRSVFSLRALDIIPSSKTNMQHALWTGAQLIDPLKMLNAIRHITGQKPSL